MEKEKEKIKEIFVRNVDGRPFFEKIVEGMDLNGGIVFNYSSFEQMRRIFETNRVRVSLDTIALYVCGMYNITLDELRSKSRLSQYVHARQIFCYISYLLQSETLDIIGYYVSKDHATVSHSKIVCENAIEMHDRILYENLVAALIHFGLWDNENQKVKMFQKDESIKTEKIRIFNKNKKGMKYGKRNYRGKGIAK